MITTLTKQTFAEKFFDVDQIDQWQYNGDIPCVIKFYTNTCVPCLRIKPTIDELSEIYKGKVEFYQIDIDVELELREVFDVEKVPTLIFVPVNGEPQLNVGSLPKETMVIVIDELLLH
jgi:thioredoxin 1